MFLFNLFCLSFISDGIDSSQEAALVKTPAVELNGHMCVVIAADWMAGGEQVITASWDRTAILYESETGEQVNTLTGKIFTYLVQIC